VTVLANLPAEELDAPAGMTGARDGDARAPFEWKDGLPLFCGLRVAFRKVEIAGHVFDVAALKDAAGLLDDPVYAKRFVDEDFAPYGLELWPASFVLADLLLRTEPWGERRALELGCGVGLVSIAASRAGWNVLATDHYDLALEFARYNAGRCGVEVGAFDHMDWRTPPDYRPFDLVFASDVLYQREDHAPILGCVERYLSQTGTCWIVDPNRPSADRFPDAVIADGHFSCEASSHEAQVGESKPMTARMFKLRRVGDRKSQT